LGVMKKIDLFAQTWKLVPKMEKVPTEFDGQLPCMHSARADRRDRAFSG
jgi:hypothetical protein